MRGSLRHVLIVACSVLTAVAALGCSGDGSDEDGGAMDDDAAVVDDATTADDAGGVCTSGEIGSCPSSTDPSCCYEAATGGCCGDVAVGMVCDDGGEPRCPAGMIPYGDCEGFGPDCS